MIGAIGGAYMLDAHSVDGFAQRLTDAVMAKVPVGAQVVFEVKTGGQRGGSVNRMIAEVQAGRQRSPWYLNKKAIEGIRFAARGLLSVAGGTRRAAEQAIKSLMLISIGENVQAQKNPDGSKFTQLTARYAAYKRRRFGYSTKILQASGDLLGGLKVEVRRSGFE